MLVTIAVLALVGAALYAAAGFWIAPRVLERELRMLARAEADLDLVAENVTMNPFTLALSLDNVTLLRPENTPVVSIGRLEGHIDGVGFGDRSLTLRDVTVRSLAIAGPAEEPVLTVPASTIGLLTVGSQEAPVAIDSPHLEGPRLDLSQGPRGLLDLPASLSFLVGLPSATGDSELMVDIARGSLALGDESSPPHRVLRIGHIDGSLARRLDGDDAVASASLRSRLPEGGRAELAAEWFPRRPRDGTHVELVLRDFDLSGASPWLEPLGGRPWTAGRTDLDMMLSVVLSAEGRVLDLDIGAVIDDLRPGGDAARARPPAFSLDSAIALLEDANGRVSLDLPPVSRRIDDRTDIAESVSRAVSDHVASLVASPFDYLAEIVEWQGDDLAALSFRPGSAEIGEDTDQKLGKLRLALGLRPRLALAVFPALDENADREALARQQIRLHVNLASSAGIPGQPAPEALDYADPVVRDVLDEFAANRLSPPRREALAGRHPGRTASYYHAVFEALVDNEDVPMPTLLRLARYRAQAVADALAVDGARNDRIRVAEEIALAEPRQGPEVLLETVSPRLDDN